MLLSNHSGYTLEAGIDEAGRGCLAGPVIAAAVILPPKYKHHLLTDSKLLSKHQRELLRIDILRDAVAWAMGEEVEQLLCEEEANQKSDEKAADRPHQARTQLDQMFDQRRR